MVIWINGAFGVGKTTTAQAVCQQSNRRLFDPEHVGFMVGGHFKDVEFTDFQDLPSWRALVPAVAEEFQLRTKAELVAVQTVLSEEYWTELHSGFQQRGLGLFHVVLECDDTELRHRINTDVVEPQAKDWRLDHIARFNEARRWLNSSADLRLDTTSVSPAAAAAQILDNAGLGR